MNVVSLLESFKNLLNKNNTVTSSYDISESLNERVKKIYKGVEGMHRTLPVPVSRYPVVFVEIASKPEEFVELGNSARRDIEFNFQLVGITNYGIGSLDEGTARENSDNEVIQLTQNIETLLRNKITLSNTVDYCAISDVDYSADVSEKTYNSIAIINVMAKKLST